MKLTRLFPESTRPTLLALAFAFAGLTCADALAADGSISLTGAPSAATPEPAAALGTEESKLVGAWLEGLSGQVRAQLAAMPPERAASAIQSLGDTLVFRADHTMTIYPRCAQRVNFGKAGVMGLSANWHVEGNKLRVTAEAQGKPLDRTTAFRLDGDELSFFESMAARPQVMGRYNGPLPPKCD
jgi:hypothetical protein